MWISPAASSSPSPLDKKENTESNEVLESKEVKAKDSQALDLESKTQAESATALDSEKAESSQISESQKTKGLDSKKVDLESENKAETAMAGDLENLESSWNLESKEAPESKQHLARIASLICPGLTALQCVAKIGEANLRNKPVLIVGANSSVGRIVGFLCEEAGALVFRASTQAEHKAKTDSNTPYATQTNITPADSSSPSHYEARSAGASHKLIESSKSLSIASARDLTSAEAHNDNKNTMASPTSYLAHNDKEKATPSVIARKPDEAIHNYRNCEALDSSRLDSHALPKDSNDPESKNRAKPTDSQTLESSTDSTNATLNQAPIAHAHAASQARHLSYTELERRAEELAGQFYAVFDCSGRVDSTLLLSLLGYYGHFVGVVGRIDSNPLPAFQSCISLHEIALGAIHSHGAAQDFTQLKTQARKLFALLNNPRFLQCLPPLKVIDFSQIPTALESLKAQNLGVKFIALI